MRFSQLVDGVDMAFDELDADSFRFFPRQCRRLDGDAVFRIVKRQDPADLWQYLFENLPVVLP